MIPEVAVEAAAIEWVGKQVWQDCNHAWRADYMERTRAMLDAAAPHMQPTATTEDELDALPIGSVVLSESYHSDVNGNAISFQRWYDGQWHRGGRSGSTHPDNFLPVTVLHIGAAQ